MKLTEGFNLLATAPDGIKRLRELILSLAVQGKLVPQDANDKPAELVLELVQKRRRILVNEGKIKKAKLNPVKTVQQPSLELPNGWCWSTLDELSPYSLTDGDWIESKDQDPNGAVRLIQLADVGDGLFKDKSDRFINDETFEKLNCTELVAGDILIARLPAPIGRACIFPGLNEKAITAVDVAILRTEGLCDSQYLMLAINSPLIRLAIEFYGKGATRFRVSTGHLKSISIPFPPLAEQSRIVAKVEELMGLCDALETRGKLEAEQHARLTATLFDALAASESTHQLQENWARLASNFDLILDRPEAVDALEQTLLQLAVRGLLVEQDPNDEPVSELLKQIRTEKDRLIAERKIKKDNPLPAISEDEKPFEVPDGWEWVALHTIASVGTGTTPSRDNSSYFLPAEISWVTSGETGRPFIEKTEQYVSAKALRETSLTVYPVGTLIVAMYGQGKTRGQISELCIPAATNQACAAIVLPLTDICMRKYVKLYFEKIYDEIRLEAAGGAQPNLNVGKVKATIIPLPPLAEQSRIVARVEALRALCAELRQRLTTRQKIQTHLAEALVENVV